MTDDQLQPDLRQPTGYEASDLVQLPEAPIEPNALPTTGPPACGDRRGPGH